MPLSDNTPATHLQLPASLGQKPAAEAVAMVLAGMLPETWSAPGTAWDVRAYSDIRVQFAGTPSTPYQPQFCLDGATFVNCKARDQDGNEVSTITTPGVFTFTAARGGYLKFSTGSGSTLTRRAGA